MSSRATDQRMRRRGGLAWPGLAEDDFTKLLDSLYCRGFPRPDPDTGHFNLDAIDQWRKLCNPHLFDSGQSRISVGRQVLDQRIAALRKTLKPSD